MLPLLMTPLLQLALIEDLGLGDLTTDALADRLGVGSAEVRAREALVISGLAWAQALTDLVDPAIQFEARIADGQRLAAGETLLTLSGSAASLLRVERTLLNLLGRACAVATHTRRFVDAVAGTGARIADTRKTTPGLRALEKQAVVHGGGHPHRYNLGTAVMLKDNHIAAVGSLADAVRHIRDRVSHTVTIEVEADTPAQVEEALSAGADIILLDNMSPDLIAAMVRLIDGRAVTEASGGLTLANCRAYAESGVQVLSTSQLTVGAPPVDIGLDWVES